MVKKVFCLGVLIVMMFVFAGCKGEYQYKEGDFNLTVIASQTEVNVGDVIEITVALKNLSGRSHKIGYNSATTVKCMPLYLQIVPKGEEANGNITLGGVYSVIEKDAVRDDTIIWNAEKSGEYYVHAVILFNIVKKHTHKMPTDIEVRIVNEKININVKE